MIAAIEAGGTKFVLAVATGPDPAEIVDRKVVPSDNPSTALAACHEFFAGRHLTALGVASFGPVDLQPGPRYGTIVGSPKLDWNGVCYVDEFATLSVPIEIDTDVNAAALVEARSLGVSRLAYLTIGTGVGGGLVVDDRPVSGRSHPEMGHLTVERYPGDDFAGICPHHGDCVEGLASGPALEARAGVERGGLNAVVSDVVPIAAWYIGQLCAAVNFIAAPDRIIIGGGVMNLPGLFAAIAEELERRIAGYTLRCAKDPALLSEPSLGTDSGIAGALALAERAARPGSRS